MIKRVKGFKKGVRYKMSTREYGTKGSMVQKVHEGVWYKREYGTKYPRGSMVQKRVWYKMSTREYGTKGSRVQNVQEKIGENLNFVENGNF